MTPETPSLFSAVICMRENTLYIDITRDVNGKPFMRITESGSAQGRHYRSVVRIFGTEPMSQFLSFVNEAGTLMMAELKSRKEVSQKAP